MWYQMVTCINEIIILYNTKDREELGQVANLYDII